MTDQEYTKPYNKCSDVTNGYDSRLLAANKHNHTKETNSSKEGKDTEFHGDRRPICCSQRWIIAFMGAWLGLMSYLLSMNMSVTVVCMVKQDYTHTQDTFVSHVTNDSSIYHTELLQDASAFNTSRQLYSIPPGAPNNVSPKSVNSGGTNETSTVHKYETGEFTWTKKEQSYILSGYFYSYGLAQIPGGWLGAKYGGRRVVGISMTVACLMTLLTPIMARSSLYLVVAIRIILGMSLGMVIPSFCGLIGVWALPTERTTMLSCLHIGTMVGAILAYSTSGLLCVHGFDNGWASVFYIHGMFGVIFVTCWWYFVYNSPSEHPRITEAEMTAILKHIKHTDNNKKKPPIPWKKIFTHVPLYISYVAHICDTWTFYLLLTCLPQYLKEVLHFDIQSNGLLSSLPMVANMVGLVIAGAGSDCVIRRTKFNVTTIRKLFLIIGFLGVGSFILIPGFLTKEHRDLAILCICLCLVFEALESVGGYCINSVDIAPKYASIIFGISNTLASLPGAVVPLIVAVITKNQTVEEWRIVFFISAGVAVFACVVYGLFANNEPAKWGGIHEDAEFDVEVPINSVQAADINSDVDT